MESMTTATQIDANAFRISPLHPATGQPPSFAVLSTYPPTQCGLATFASALTKGLGEIGVARVGVVQVESDAAGVRSPEVVATLRNGDARSRVEAARVINSFDVLLVQHEFGIFGGSEGSEILELLDDVHVPVIVTMHTVPLEPSARQREVFEALTLRADALVAMTQVAHDRCLMKFPVDPAKVVTVPHGATVPRYVNMPPLYRTSLLTWGLLGPGKGIEWVIDALAMVPDLRDTVQYTIAGQTHPKVKAREGEQYRDSLRARAEALGVASMVSFDDSYRSLDSLIDLIGRSTCVVLPYDSNDQITSGVLVDALSVGRPVIATEFPHARELLSDGAGIVVPHRDPVTMAQAIRRVATDPELVNRMVENTLPIARDHRWSAVAARYVDLGVQVMAKGRVF